MLTLLWGFDGELWRLFNGFVGGFSVEFLLGNFGGFLVECWTKKIEVFKRNVL